MPPWPDQQSGAVVLAMIVRDTTFCTPFASVTVTVMVDWLPIRYPSQ